MADGGAAQAELTSSVPQAEAVRWYREMSVIRAFEDAVFELFAKGLVRGSTHLCQGQEAVAVGVAAAALTSDLMTCTYRGHGQCLAWGMPVESAMAEILGRRTGCCGGKGGSMHLTDLSRGILGSFAIVGAGLPVAAGAAWASMLRRDGHVAVAFFGDGATNIGAFHETLNISSVWRLPVVFVCENNLYGEYSPIRETTPVADLADRATAHAMPSAVVDGNDVLAVYHASSEALHRARAGDGPSLLEMKTYRQKGHSRGDPAKYRPPEEVEFWLGRDPIALWRGRLVDEGLLAETEAEAIAQEAIVTVAAATEAALEAPQPTSEELLTHVLSR